MASAGAARSGVHRHLPRPRAGMPQAALDAIKGIDAALETVRTFPDAGGHFTDDHLEHEYRTTLAGPYIIYYRYNATTLTVYRIMHQRQSIDTYSLIEY
ncbi:MAG: type II toxin-antitoxin system RelE/ParE family toxin [Collinsella sp.]